MTPASTSVPTAWLPAADDERLQTPTGDTSLPWKDTFYFSMRDDAADLTLNMHMTVSENRTPPTRVGVSVAGGGAVATEVLRNEGENNDQGVGNELGRLEFINLSYDSDHELRWTGNLPEVSFEVTVKGKHYAPLWDTMFPDFYPTGKQGHQYSHYEQVVTGDGWVQWKGGERLPFSGSGWRDRGWGRRKTVLTFNTSMDLIAAVLPDDSVFSLIALRSGEVSKDAPMPIGGWRSDPDSLSPLVGGTYHKDAMAFPEKLELSFQDGYTLSAQKVRNTASIPCAWHDADPEQMGIAIGLRDYYTVMEDSEGRQFTVFSNYGDVHKVDVFRDAEFKYIA